MKYLLLLFTLLFCLGADIAFGQTYQNYLINGGFDFWQRGNTNAYTNSDGYLADRWFVVLAGGSTVTYDRIATNLPTGQKYGAQIATTSAYAWLCQRIESANTLPLSGQKMTISGYERSDSGTSALKLKIDYANSVDTWGTGTQRGKAATGFTSALSPTVLLSSTSTTLTPFRYTFTVSANMATNGFQVCLGTDSVVTNTYQFSAIMLNEGMKKQKFQRFGKTFDGELRAAQRFYEKSYVLDQAPGGVCNTTNAAFSTCAKYYTAQYTNCHGIDYKATKFKAPGYGYVHTYDCAGTIDCVSDENPGYPTIDGIANYIDVNKINSFEVLIPTNHDNMSAQFNWTSDAEL